MGYLSWGVPMMAYALVSGSTYAMVGAISSMDSAGKSAANTGAQTASTGNLSLGNDSLDTFKANDVAAGNMSFRNKQIGNKQIGNTNIRNTQIGNTNEGSKTYASNTGTGNDLLMGVSAGALNSKNFHGAINDTGGQTNISGQVTRQGLSNMVNDGVLTSSALTESREMLKDNPNAQVFSLTASGTTGGGFSTVNLKRGETAERTNTGKKTNTLSVASTKSSEETVGQGGRGLLSKTTPLGSVAGDITGGTVTKKGGVTSLKGLIDRQGLKKLTGKGGLYGNTAGAKAIQQYLRKHPHQKTFGIDAAGNKAGLSNLEISKNRSSNFTSNGNQSDYWTLTKGKSTNKYLNSSNVYEGKHKYFGNSMTIGNSLENAATGDALVPNSFNNKNLSSKINAYATLGGLSTPNGVQAAGQAVTNGITRYLKKSKGFNKSWHSMSKVQQDAAISAYAKAGFEVDGNGAEVKVSTKTAYEHALQWMSNHPNDTMVDYYKANMQKGFNSIAQLPKSQRTAAFTKFALNSAKGANTIMGQHGLKVISGYTGANINPGGDPKNKGSVPSKDVKIIDDITD